jgi:hypothetical protein
MIELTLADGKEMDIPEGSIVQFEEMKEDTNPNFPTARAFIFYRLAGEILTATLNNKFEDILFETKATTDPRWLRLTLEDGRRIGLLKDAIISRRSKDDGCTLTVAVTEQPQVIDVKESRREIKKWSERPAPVPTQEQ